jgi:predicted nucleotidyltransferase
MLEMLRKWKEYGDRIAEAASHVLGECEVFTFGSVVEGRATGGSDVDILVVSRNLPQGDRSHLKALIEERAGCRPFIRSRYTLSPRRRPSGTGGTEGRSSGSGRSGSRTEGALTSPVEGWG